MPTKHTAQVVRTVEVPFDCAKCHYAGTAMVDAEGTATSTSFIGIDRDAALEDARQGAEEDAHRHGQITMSLYPCPRCGHSSRSGRGWFIAVTALAALSVAAMGVASVWLLGGYGLICCVGFGIGGVALVRKRREHYVLARALVQRIVPRAQLPAAVVVKAPPPRPVQPPKIQTAEPSPDGKPRVLT